MRRAVAVVLIAFFAAFLVMWQAPEATTGSEAGSNLSADAESVAAQKALASLPKSDTTVAIAVFSRDGEALNEADLGHIAGLAKPLADIAVDEIAGPIPSEDKTVALLNIPVPDGLTNDENSKNIDDIRAIISKDLPEGVTSELTGPAAVFADIGDVFSGADVKLLITTAAVVAILLILTYRSPWLWVVPLTVIGVADRTAASLLQYVSATFDRALDGSITGIVSVLVFGAGTNYALLLIARYREELRRNHHRLDAMTEAWKRSAPAIAFSSLTVMISLVVLGFAEAPFVSSIGIFGAVGIATALLFALIVLPCAMVLFGRWLFWPAVPRFGTAEKSTNGMWAKLGTTVTRFPTTVLVSGFAVLAALAWVASLANTGLSQDEQFLDNPESIRAQSTLAQAFPGGTSSPVKVVTSPESALAISELLEKRDDVASTRMIDAPEISEVQATLIHEPQSKAALDSIRDIREEVDSVDATALVGGVDAETVDEADTASSDRLKLIPAVMVIVFVMLLILLRSITAAVMLSAITVLSWISALGAGWLVFDHLFGWGAMDVSVVLLSFIFLVALGVDYNIFLTARTRQEVVDTGDHRQSIITALAVTGGVITSAGILLAAVFAVLGVLPLVLLAQLGTIVGIGVLLDAILVRSIITPALMQRFGPAFWWPSRPGQPKAGRRALR